jgi:hypothetical protein
LVRSVNVTAISQGTARWPDSIQTSQFTPGDRNTRCWHGCPPVRDFHSYSLPISRRTSVL